MAPKIIIAGAPASGKGTQCEMIKERYGVVHLSTGDMLRQAAKEGTEVGLKAQQFMNEGKLVTDEIIIGIIVERLAKPDCLEKGWLLDGFPRTRAQADALAGAGITADIFVFLDVPDEILVERVVGRRTDPETGKIYHMTFSPPEDDEIEARLTQRGDDTEEKVKVRLEGFHSNIAAIIDVYHLICVKVNGNGDKKLIFGLIKDFIDAAKIYGEGDYKTAMKAYKTACDDAAALATKEALAAGLVGEARCQIMLGHLKKAAQIVDEIPTLDPENKAHPLLLDMIHHEAEGKLLKRGSTGLKLIIAGAPASGKGTQCEIIRERYGVVHLSTGDMLRAAVAAESDVGMKAKQCMEAGELVSDNIIIGVVKERLAQPDCMQKGWLLDGFPRTRAQADALAAAGIKADAFVFLDVPDEDLIARVVGRRTDPETGKIYHMTFSPPESEEIAARLTQRADDTEEKVKVRLEAFHANVGSIASCYTDIMFQVKGDQNKHVVCKQITDHLDVVGKFQCVFVLGGPGSGKGTQCTRIKEEFGYVHLSAGDLLRAERNSGSENGEMISNFIKEGKIVPAEVTVGLLKEAMKKSHSRKFLIDGFPRSKDNLDTWYQVMGDDFVLQMVLVFDCPEEVLQERLLDRGKTSGRSDDNIASIKKRFKTFHTQSEPVINEFKRMGKVRIVNSVPPTDVVFEDVKKLFVGAQYTPSVERTLAMIKPDAVKNGSVDSIVEKIEAAGFVVVARKNQQLSAAQAAEFYAEHEAKPFFGGLTTFMTSGPVVALLLEKPDAIKDWRALMGPTNTEKARAEAPESLRALFGTDGTMNATHGSDSFISAAREAAFWFSGDLIKERTLAMIKPIISETKKAEVMGILRYQGFEIVAEVTMKLSSSDIEIFYAEHKGKSFFPALAAYMGSGSVVALCLEKEGAIKSWRGLLGPTNPEVAKRSVPQCLRALFGLDGTRNGTHGSDSSMSARKELSFWFNTSRVDIGRAPAGDGTSPQQMDALKYLKEYVDPIMAPLLQRILSVRPEDVNTYVRDDLGGKL
ncbi:hypothetical protein TL16_g10037 [Triparma laevis f. inornata]|uniref:UMP-CMP kinase n=2 Tax=Triparma laevis TaxID=1534972 RepID=A0A9W6ZAR8_9STRA|nr:hypothetical protein TrLO_g12745 [Triparma laevis f. longispina]GMH84813.1 hypothetical protein TL16_g10037 [Triparma laevis f. inornata]